MSKKFKIIKNIKEFNKNITDGMFWQDFIKGKNYNIDLIIKDGEIYKKNILFSKPNLKKEGTFDYHTNIDVDEKNINMKKIKDWLDLILPYFTGFINLEIIDNKIIEVHLRPNGDFFYYSNEDLKKIINLFKNDKWEDFKFKKMYLIPHFISNEKFLNNKDFLTKNLEKYKKILDNKNILSIYSDKLNAKYQNESFKRIFIF